MELGLNSVKSKQLQATAYKLIIKQTAINVATSGTVNWWTFQRRALRCIIHGLQGL